MLAINEVLQGRYRIIRRLGHGGMGAVYEARDERLGSSVALKEIVIDGKISTQSPREIFQRAFEREAKLLANLHHEVFPRVMDYFSEQNQQFLIMELVHGDDLSELLSKNNQPFTLGKTVRWIDDLLDALDYLHTQNPPTFHRDIKPQNLKLTAREKIKLLDFGIAKSVDQSGTTMANQTLVGATLEYAPIEQVLPATPTAFREFIILKHKDKAMAVLQQSTDARCDIYAVGATFYHLLTGHVPVDSAQRSLQIWEGNKDPLPNPAEINPDIPLSVSVWLLKSLEVNRENRFSSADEMRKAWRATIKKAKTETANKPLIPPEQKTSGEKLRTEAETEKLPGIGQSPPQIKPKIFSDTPPLHRPLPATQSHSSEAAVTEPLPLYNTNSAANTSQPELTATPYFDVKFLDKRKTSPEIALAVNKPIEQAESNKSTLFWAVPAVLLSFLALAAVGGFVWLLVLSSNQPASNKSGANVMTTPVSTDLATPMTSPIDQPKPSSSRNKPETTKQNVAATPDKTPALVIKTTKTPKPEKVLDRSDDCVYNGRCKN